MKKYIALLLVLSMALSLCACGPTGNQTNNNPDDQNEPVVVGDDTATDLTYLEGFWPESYLRDRIVIGTSKDGGGFAAVSNSPWGSVDFSLYEKLLILDSAGNERLQLLKSWEKVDDLTYQFEIWDCIYDSAGNHITASDVKFSLQEFVNHGQKGGLNCLNLLDGDIVDIELTGDYTFIWHCSKPFATGEFGKNLSNCSIFSQKGYEASGDEYLTEPVGTGPYMLKEYVVGSKAIFEANPNYWMKSVTDTEWLSKNFYATNCQNVREIEYDIIQDAATRAMALEMGDVCAIDTANAADINAYLADPSYGISPVRKLIGAPIAFYFDCNEASICSDVNMRKAICYAIDCQAIADSNSYPAYPVYGLQPNMFDAPASWTTGEGRDYYTYSVEKSKEYQELAGYHGETLKIMYMENGAITDAMIVLQGQLRAAGITLELQPVDQNTLDSYKADYSKWDMICDIMGGGWYLANTLKKFWSGDWTDSNGNTALAIRDEKLDELFLAVQEDSSAENVEAWDQYFTYDNCYGYAMLRYFEQTACLSEVNAVIEGSTNFLVPGAFTFND